MALLLSRRCHDYGAHELRALGMCGGLSVQHKFITGLVGLVLSVAVVTVLVGVDTEVKAELSRLDARPLNWGCAQEPWPHG